jgi:hypothetical protein
MEKHVVLNWSDRKVYETDSIQFVMPIWVVRTDSVGCLDQKLENFAIFKNNFWNKI